MRIPIIISAMEEYIARIRRTLFSSAKVSFAALFLLLPLTLAAQEVLLRKDNFHTELFLKVPPQNIASVQKSASTVTVKFKRAIKPFTNKFEDPYFELVKGAGTELTVTFKPDADFAVFSDPEGLRFMAAPPKTKSDVLLSYGVGTPLLRKEGVFVQEPRAEAALKDSDALFQNGKLNEALARADWVEKNATNDYYIHEALYKKGLIYMEMGKTTPNAYINASLTFDELISLFPDSNRLGQIRLLNALAKRNADQVVEAIAAYQSLYQNSGDSATRRDALMQIGALYERMGQYERAIDTYKTYLANFQAGADDARAQLGKLYISRNHADDAFKSYVSMPTDTIARNLTEPEMMSIAKIFEDKKEDARALDIYAIISKPAPIDDPDLHDSPYRAEALYHISQIYKRKGSKEAYSKTLATLYSDFPSTEYGLKAAVEYGEMHYGEKPLEEWQEIYTPLFKVEDIFDLRPRARMVEIRSLEKDNDSARLVSMIDDYIKEFSTSPELPYLLKLKEDTLYAQAVQLQGEKRYPEALAVYQGLLAEFPESARGGIYNQNIDDIYFDQAKTFYAATNFSSTIKFAENRILNPPPPAKRWFDLREDAIYQDVLSLIGSAPQTTIRFRSREYLSEFPRGKYVKEFRGFLIDAFNSPFEAAYRGQNYGEVIRLYDENRPWLDIWNDQNYSNRVKLTVASSLFTSGLTPKAEEVYKTITPMMSSDYAILGYSLCKKPLYDINKLSPAEFLSVLDAAESCGGQDRALELIGSYNNKQVALKALYDRMKNITDNARREEVLNDIYKQVDSGSRFEGYEEVYLDKGLSAFKKNDFAGALVPLKQYVDTARETGDKKSEALYYLGKSYLAINDKNQGLTYMRQIVNNMPDSIYKNMAKSELDSDAWKNSLK